MARERGRRRPGQRRWTRLSARGNRGDPTTTAGDPRLAPPCGAGRAPGRGVATKTQHHRCLTSSPRRRRRCAFRAGVAGPLEDSWTAAVPDTSRAPPRPPYTPVPAGERSDSDGRPSLLASGGGAKRRRASGAAPTSPSHSGQRPRPTAAVSATSACPPRPLLRPLLSELSPRRGCACTRAVRCQGVRLARRPRTLWPPRPPPALPMNGAPPVGATPPPLTPLRAAVGVGRMRARAAAAARPTRCRLCQEARGGAAAAVASGAAARGAAAAVAPGAAAHRYARGKPAHGASTVQPDLSLYSRRGPQRRCRIPKRFVCRADNSQTSKTRRTPQPSTQPDTLRQPMGG